MIFPKQPIEKTLEEKTLTVEEKKQLTDCALKGWSRRVAVNQTGIDIGLVKKSYEKKRQIIGKVYDIMYGTAILEINEETGEITYCSIPQNAQELKDTAYAFFPDCDREAFDYNIDGILSGFDSRDMFVQLFTMETE